MQLLTSTSLFFIIQKQDTQDKVWYSEGHTGTRQEGRLVGNFLLSKEEKKLNRITLFQNQTNIPIIKT